MLPTLCSRLAVGQVSPALLSHLVTRFVVTSLHPLLSHLFARFVVTDISSTALLSHLFTRFVFMSLHPLCCHISSLALLSHLFTRSVVTSPFLSENEPLTFQRDNLLTCDQNSCLHMRYNKLYHIQQSRICTSCACYCYLIINRTYSLRSGVLLITVEQYTNQSELPVPEHKNECK